MRAEEAGCKVWWQAWLKTGMRALRSSQRGQSAVELSLAMLLLAAILVGSVDAARATYSFMAVTGAAASGAFYGSQGASFASNTNGIRTAALADCQSLAGTTPTVDVQLQTDADGIQAVSVTVTYWMETAGWPGLANPLELSKTVVMRVLP